MNYVTTENAIEMPVSNATISAILNETDAVLSECLNALDKMVVQICGNTPLEEKKADPRCMRDCVKLTADKALQVRNGILCLMEAIGV